MDSVNAELLKAVVETVVDGIITIDEAGQIITANPAVTAIFGYSSAELIGQNVKMLMPTPYHEEHDAYLQNYQTTGERKIIGIGREVSGRRKDGTVFPLDLAVGETSTPDGKLFTGVLRDISDRKRADEALLKERGLLKAVVETAVDGILTIDEMGTIQTANPATESIFGYAAEGLIGQNVRMLMPSPYHEEHDGYLQNFRETGVKKIIGIGREVQGLRKSGEIFPIDLAVSETKTEQGTVFTGIVRDASERKKTERALRESEERFRFLNDLAGELRTVSDPDEVMTVTARMLGVQLGASRCAYANVGDDGDQFMIVHDYTNGCMSAVGHYRLSQFGEEPGETLRAGKTLVLRNISSDFEDEAAEKSSSMGIAASISCPLVKDNALKAIMAVHQTEPRDWLPSEITLVEDVVERCWATIERIQAQQALLQQQLELRALFDLMPAMIWFKDTSNRVLRVNKHAALIAGLEVEEVEGRPAGDIYPLDADRYYQDDLEVIRSGVPKLGIIEPLRGPDGSEVWIQTDKVPVKSWDGRVVGIVVMAQDVTSRRKAEEQLRLLSSAVEQSTDAVIITDASLDLPGPRILFVNPAFAQMTGYRAEEVLGQTPRILQGPDTDRAVLDQLRKTLERGDIFDGEAINYRKDGTPYIQHWQVVPLRNEDRVITHFVAVLRDVTEQRENEAALKRAFEEVEHQVEVRTAALAHANSELRVAIEQADASSRAKSEFLSRMSHELRTPMNSVLGYAQLLNLQYQDPRIQDSANCILRSGNHLLQMINEVLDLSRIESGELAVSKEPVEFVGVMTQAMTLVQPLADAAKVQIRIRGEIKSNLHVQADRQRLLQVLINIFGNAIKYNHEGGSVEISCHEEWEEKVRVDITDTGPGISEADRANLFQPFQRFGDQGVEGTGLGLVLSERFMNLMGGKLWLRDSSEMGSTFCLDLIVAEPTSAPERVGESESVGFSMLDGYRGTVLYIEDNPANMRLLETVLEGVPDVHLIPAIQGSMGMDLATQHLPDLILLDVHLPDINGDSVLRQLKGNPTTSQIPVVMLSADATKKQIELLTSLGAADYLTKPIDLVVFFDILRQYLPRD